MERITHFKVLLFINHSTGSGILRKNAGKRLRGTDCKKGSTDIGQQMREREIERERERERERLVMASLASLL